MTTVVTVPVPVCTDVVPVHAERTADPRTLRWYVGQALAGIVGDSGALREAWQALPSLPLSELVDTGVLATVEIAGDHVATSLGRGQSWADVAPTVRAAVQEAVRAHRRQTDDADPAARDALLARVAGEVIADLVAPTASAHGGAVELVEVMDGMVTVRMRGACHGCPAAAATLHGRLERELRSRLPWLVGVRVASGWTGRPDTHTLRLVPWAGPAGCDAADGLSGPCHASTPR